MPFSRKKSCARCRASKLRCNQAIPTCSRCAERSLCCIYDGRDGERAAPYPAPGLRRRHHMPVERYREPLDGAMAEIDILASSSHPNRSSGAETPLPDYYQDLPLDWTLVNDLNLDGGLGRGFKCSDLPSLDPQPMSMTQRLDDHSDDSPPASRISTSVLLEPGDYSDNLWALDLPDGITPARQTLSLKTVGITHPSSQRTLLRRGAHKACPLTSVVLGQIMSYPKMMLDGDQLPPFVQAPCHTDEELAQDCAEGGKHRCLPKSLAVCAGLVRMFYDRTSANAAYVWTSVYAEVERLRREYDHLSTIDQLSALQSLMLYLILQAEDHESVSENNVGDLIMVITELVMDLAAKCKWSADLPEGRPDRCEWVLRESLRRIIILLSIIDLLLEGIIAASGISCHDFEEVPLPSNRGLWGARTNREWRTEYTRFLSTRTTSKVLTVGDLVESEEAGCFTKIGANNDRTAPVFSDLHRWCDGLDALGTLVWMAMPFQQHKNRKSGR